jgi:hypothetical protein
MIIYVKPTNQLTVTFSASRGLLPASTAQNDFIVSNNVFTWVKKTLAEVKNILGIIQYTFQTPAFANPLNLDATIYKDFKAGLITGGTTINLNNAVDGDAGMIEITMDGVGGHAVLLGAMFTKQLGATLLQTGANQDNFISYRKIGADIVYTIIQKI